MQKKLLTNFGCFKSKEKEANLWISINYCPKLKLKEGLRELLQNQSDEIIFFVGKNNIETIVIDLLNYNEFHFIDKESGASAGRIKYDDKDSTLYIENEGHLKDIIYY